MKHVLLLACVALPALGQPLPLAWPDRPQGTVLYTVNPVLFDGASTNAGDHEMIVAWCDMRDGYGRLMFQKISSLDPAAPGPWNSQVEGLGTVNALVGPVSLVTPFSPVLAPDDAGGAFVLWQEVNTSWHGQLHLQRVGDGGAVGTFHWPTDLILAAEVPLPFDDCRDDHARCRSLADAKRTLCADGTGGAWVLWREMDNNLMLQHVTADGTLDPDFPTTGLPLSTSAYNFQLACDALGNALFFYRANDGVSSVLRVMGVRPDGSWLLPDISRQLSAADMSVTTFSCAPALDVGRILVSWQGSSPQASQQVRAQLLGQDLTDLWPADGLLVDLADDHGTLACATAGAAPYYVSYATSTGWLAQQLDEQGTAQWSPPASLEMVGDGVPETVRSMAADDQGLAFLADYYSRLYLQRLTSDGAQAWPVETALLTPPDHFETYRGTVGISQGEVQLIWGDYTERDLHYRLTRRDLAGQDLNGPEESAFLSSTAYNTRGPELASGVLNPLFIWGRDDSLFAQSVDAHTGLPRWGDLDRSLGSCTFDMPAQATEVVDGAWILSYEVMPVSYAYLLFAQKVDRDGQPLTPRVAVAPGDSDLPGFWGQDHARIVQHGEQVYVAFEDWRDQTFTIKLQRLSDAGERLWGDLGISLPSTNPAGRLVGVAAAPFGGVDLCLVEVMNTVPGFFLQHFDAAGQPVYEENDGRGLRADMTVSAWMNRELFLPLPDGGRLLLSSFDASALQLQAFDSSGGTLWARQIPDVGVYNHSVELDPQGRIWLVWYHADAAAASINLQRLLSNGLPEQSWSLPLTGAQYPSNGRWCMVRTSLPSCSRPTEWTTSEDLN